MNRIILFFVLLAVCISVYCREVYKFERSSIYDVCFVPGRNCDEMIADTIDRARYVLNIQAYHATNHIILRAIRNAADRNVKVTVILDKNAKREIYPFMRKNISVYIDKNRSIAHNKVIIIDHIITGTGSFNFTEAAQKRNVENFILIADLGLSAQYERNFKERLSESYMVR